jgi:hypothetical protein
VDCGLSSLHGSFQVLMHRLEAVTQVPLEVLEVLSSAVIVAPAVPPITAYSECSVRDGGVRIKNGRLNTRDVSEKILE